MSRYVGVVTTGIYCLPGACAGRPLEHNRRSFNSPAAAEAAGYRACQLCRPYRTESGWLTHAPALVCAALGLVLDGALDHGGTEAELAAAVGASPRHLRRLFQHHVGATPAQIARSARAHFARRLIDDTDCTFTEIASMAAFGSVRQFNAVMQQTFKASPTQLRAKRRATDRLVVDGGLAVRVPCRESFDFGRALDALAAESVPGVSVVADRVFRRTFRVHGDPAVVEVEAEDPSGRALIARFHLPHWAGLLHHVQSIRRLLDLDGAAASQPDPSAVGCWDPFESGVLAILSATGDRDRAVRSIVTAFGTPIGGLADYQLTHLFPQPHDLAAGDLEHYGIPATEAATLQQFASVTASGRLRLDRSSTRATLMRDLAANDVHCSALVDALSARLDLTRTVHGASREYTNATH
jgi:AraC family transcriptional regulator, regulatory protein of adaptative response / DNA-3-methyladenine glycosylase II